ncbi:DNA gyrase inhibitor YacG [Niveispirillum irakense]|uniref:DNA gyrase inhibitor YacG n=1 Tax=Niveispirillum irakense TaxID=34011 RepID=UPI0004040DBE|nr:DNA gyrase inhibitor YacG [Niveispirillum irakense]
MSDEPIDLSAVRPKRKAPSCPICGRPVVVEFKPFCSKRCADIDLSRWLGEVYRVPVEGEEEGSEQGLEKNRRLDE